MNRDASVSRDIDTRLDQLCDAFERAWREGRQPRIEEWLAQAGAPLGKHLLPELLCSDVECRRRRGENPTFEDYRARFPEQAALLSELFPAPASAAALRGLFEGNVASATTVPELIASVQRLQLLPAKQLAELTTLGAKHSQVKDLARELLQRAWFTAYQVNRLFQGRAQELSLGSYVVLDRLGQGGMGAVYKARHKAMGRLVALKVIRREHLTSVSAVRRFEREMRAVAQLDHPSIVRAYDADHFAGTYLLVMEFIEGGVDLAKVVKQRGPLPVAEACEYIRQTALGLQHAHERGLVHRDIKPHNLLMSAACGLANGARVTSAKPLAGVVKILDMGLARIRHASTDTCESSSALTREGMVMGTLDYIAPEQATDSHSVDARADLYSLGCTFYYLLAGRPPFPGGEALAKLMKHKTEEPTPIEQARPEVLPAVGDIVRRLMAKQPDDRFQTSGELAAALANVMLLFSGDFSLAPSDSDTAPTLADSPGAIEGRPQAVAVPNSAAPPVRAAPTAWSEIIGSDSATDALVKAPPQVAGGKSWFWPWGSIGAAAMLLLAIVLIWQPWRPGEPKGDNFDPFLPGPKRVQGPALDGAEREAERALNELVARLKDRNAAPKTQRDELRTFLRQHSGTAAASKACEHLGDLLARMPSPLDKLSRSNLPADCIENWKTWQRAAGDKYAAGPPPELVAAIGEHRQRHWDSAISVSLSPDGKLLASIGVRDNAVCLWDAETMELLQYVHFGWYGVNVAFAPDGKSLAASNYDDICVFDVADRRLTEASRVACPNSNHLAWSPDGTRLATVNSDQFIRLWDYCDKKLQLNWKSAKQEGNPEAVVFTLAGKGLVTGHGETVPAGMEPVGSLHVWDLSNGGPAVLQSVKVKRGLARGLTLSADSQYLAWAGQHLQAWRLTFKGPVRNDAVELQEINGADLDNLKSNQGSCWLGRAPFLVVRYYNKLRVVHFLDGKPRLHADLDIPPLHTPCLASSADGKVLAGGLNEDGGVRVWDVIETEVKVPGPEDAQGLRVVPYPSKLTERRPPDPRFTGVTALCFSPEGELAVGGLDGAVHLWDFSGSTKETWFRTGEAAGATPRYLGTGGCPPNPSRVFGISFLPGGKRFAVAVGHHVEIWERGAENARIFDGKPRLGNSLALAPDGATLVSAFQDGPLRFYNVAESGRECRVGDESPGKSTPAWSAFSPDGARLAVACQNMNVVQLWRMPAQEAQVTSEVSVQSPVWTAFTPDGGTLLVAGQNNEVTRWDATRTPPTAIGKPLQVLNQSQYFKSLDISPDGRWLAALRCDGGVAYSYHVVIWDLLEQRIEREWPWPGNIFHLRFAPDGRHVAVGNSNGTVYILRFIPDELRPWREKVAELPHQGQVAAVLEKLKELNPAFEAKMDQKTRKDDEGKPFHHYVDQGKVLHFNLYSDRLTDLTPVRAFPHLVGLECEGSSFGKDKRGTGELKDLHALRGLRLTSLSFSTNPHVSDLSPLAKMPLQVLALPCTAVSDLSPLRGMSLFTLNCRGCPISDLEPLVGMPLGWLDVGDTSVKDLSPLKGMAMKTLYADSTPVSDLHPLATMTELELLWLQKTKVVDLRPLHNLPVQELDLGECAVSDLRPLATLKKLEVLRMQKTRVVDLAPLQGLPLRELSLEECPVSNLQPLAKSTKLQILWLRKTKVVDLKPLQKLPLVSIYLDYEPARHRAALAAIKTLTHINGQSAAIVLGQR